MELRKFIKTTIREYLNEVYSNEKFITILLKNIPKEINGESVVYRFCSKEEIDDILNGGSSGVFWHTDPYNYVNYGTHLIVTPIKSIKLLSSKSKEDDGSIQFVGGKINKNNPIIIIHKETSNILYNNTKNKKNKLNPFDDKNFVDNLILFLDKLNYTALLINKEIEYYNEEIYDAFLDAKKTDIFDNPLLDKHSENQEKIKKFINNGGYNVNDFHIGFYKIFLDK